jgi:ribosomal protein S24E
MAHNSQSFWGFPQTNTYTTLYTKYTQLNDVEKKYRLSVGGEMGAGGEESETQVGI